VVTTIGDDDADTKVLIILYVFSSVMALLGWRLTPQQLQVATTDR